jgi:hypothetical protein
MPTQSRYFSSAARAPQSESMVSLELCLPGMAYHDVADTVGLVGFHDVVIHYIDKPFVGNDDVPELVDVLFQDFSSMTFFFG